MNKTTHFIKTGLLVIVMACTAGVLLANVML